MRKFFKCFSAFLAFLFLFNMFPANAFSITSSLTGKCGKNAYYSYDEKTATLTISGYGAIYDYVYKEDYNNPDAFYGS